MVVRRRKERRGNEHPHSFRARQRSTAICIFPLRPEYSLLSLSRILILREMVQPSVLLRFQRTAFRSVTMIKKGDTIPTAKFAWVPNTPSLRDISIVGHLATLYDASHRDLQCGVPQKLSTDDWKGKKIVLFGVPGGQSSLLCYRSVLIYATTAFTSTCSVQHLPPFVKSYEKFIAKGVDSVHCVAANDVFVQSAWGRISNVEEKVIMLSDSKLDWLQAAGLTQDCSSFIPSLSHSTDFASRSICCWLWDPLEAIRDGH